MQGIQLPLWLVVALALVGPVMTLVAALASQWLAARAIARREEVRLKHETASAYHQQQLDSKLHWREHRLEIYSAFLGRVDSLGKLIADASKRERKIPFEMDDNDQQVKNELDGLWETWFRIVLIGSPDVTRISKDIIATRTAHVMGSVWKIAMASTPSDGDVKRPTYVELEVGLRNAMRQDLAIDIPLPLVAPFGN